MTGRIAPLACVIALALAPLAASAGPARGVLQEMWDGVPGDRVVDLVSSAAYRKPAPLVRVLPRFDVRDLGDNYGARLTAILVPPRSGSYRFYLSTDDGGELALGSSPTTLRRIAVVSGYTDPDSWEAQPGQASSPITLQAGKRYLLRAIQKQGGGGNHCRVAWSGPGIRRQLIAPDCLRLPAMPPAMRARIAAAAAADARRRALQARAEAYWRKGRTLPLSFAAASPVGPAPSADHDNGINVLVDQAHQTQFAVLWGLNGLIQQQRFRTCTSLASLDTVLKPGNPCRIRLPLGNVEPFAWWPAPRWNVVITCQQDLNAQVYTPAERAALVAFVRAGGGLMIVGGSPGSADKAAGWSLNRLCREFGAELTAENDRSGRRQFPVAKLDSAWQVLATGEQGRPIRARRSFGKGRVMLGETTAIFAPEEKVDSPAAGKAKLDLLRDQLAWLASGRPPVRGDGRMPSAGSAGIFPELELNTGGIVVYYSANTPPVALDTIRHGLPTSARRVLQWLPTAQFAEPYTMVMCAGGGGGWAIQARPKMSAVIEYDRLGILGVFGHEFAHTMSGPVGAAGILAGQDPNGNQGESHAGWFQGKITALFDPAARMKSNRDCNSILEKERKKGALLDLATEDETEKGRANWGYGLGWTKEWWVFQKLDDRFGPTWYPRWYWVRNTRWARDPGHALTWDEMVEDMSIAVGEDLFPFFRRIGTSLKRDRLGPVVFQGKRLDLPESPLDTGPGGPVHLEPIGDYRQELPRPNR